MSHLQVQAVGSQFGYAAVHNEAFLVHSQAHFVGLKVGLAAVQLAYETLHTQVQVLESKVGYAGLVQLACVFVQMQEQEVWSQVGKAVVQFT
jgi:hypothetical protein